MCRRCLSLFNQNRNQNHNRNHCHYYYYHTKDMDRRVLDLDSNMAENKGRNGKDSDDNRYGRAVNHDVRDLHTHTFSPHFAVLELGTATLKPPD